MVLVLVSIFLIRAAEQWAVVHQAMLLSNSYLCLGEDFFQRIKPSPAIKPKLFLWNATLATELGLTEALFDDEVARAQLFSGNELFPNSTPIALAYAGHQFGHFNPQLGDGRAHLLGEVKGCDLQLKGSGRTRFSRGGDGRCALGPAIREFIMSEAMHALGVPSSRALAVVTTGEQVIRDRPVPGAVVTRVASSHLRVGSFEYFYAQNKLEQLNKLCDFAIERHFPQLKVFEGPERYLAFLDGVFKAQVNLIVEWMRVGFIHGVMNTDNCSIAGETIDYGPCAMMNSYNPNTVYSSIDQNGRYSFGNQAGIAQWNMARLAECFLPLIDSDEKSAQQKAMPLLTEFAQHYHSQHTQMLAKKVGLRAADGEDEKLLNVLLASMRRHHLDYTQTFDQLSDSLLHEPHERVDEHIEPWYSQWRQRLDAEQRPLSEIAEEMRKHNPRLIPRNHHVEAVLQECIDSGSAQAAEPFLAVLRKPYELMANTPHYQDSPEDGDRYYQTFCGT
ncbi:Uncharacterized conserved protein YdiU, UPF0061 family [Alteromonadaceae bacterium Bs31]|nr:Uncharacterized conserved protein YdiU, UPF0061 family [Alteromonadaceae bacterium Bs31]